MSDLKLVALILPVMVPVLIGWLAVRLRVLKASDSNALSAAYLHVFLPALIIYHLATQKLSALFNGPFILATATSMLAIYGLVLLVYKLVLGRPLDTSALAAFAASKFNAVVLGLPLLLIAIGRTAVNAVIINVVLGYFTILPLTLVLLEISKERGSLRLPTLLAKAIRHAAFDPLVIVTAVGLVLAAMRVEMPSWVSQSLFTLGSAAVAVPLLAVGMTMSEIHFNENLGDVALISAARVIASPVLAIGVSKLFALSPAYAIALVVSFSLPTAKMAFALAEAHGVYVRPLAAILAVTTISMVISYPVIIWVCESLWPGIIGVPP